MAYENTLLLFKALGEESKHRILLLLTKGEYCACEIPTLIRRTQSNTSMHLAKLQEWGIIKSRRDGKKIIYSIKDKRLGLVFKVLGYPENKLTKYCCCANKRVGV